MRLIKPIQAIYKRSTEDISANLSNTGADLYSASSGLPSQTVLSTRLAASCHLRPCQLQLRTCILFE